MSNTEEALKKAKQNKSILGEGYEKVTKYTLFF